MPVKFKETIKNRNGSVQNFYMKSTPTDELLSAMDSNNTPNKKKQKIRKELAKRGHA